MVLVLALCIKKKIQNVIVLLTNLLQEQELSSKQLENEYAGVHRNGIQIPIHRNAIPQCDSFEENGYTKEEMKLVVRLKKILDDRTIAVTATAVRANRWWT
jgi:aspartate-semialdehyde dehydrogenase